MNLHGERPEHRLEVVVPERVVVVEPGRGVVVVGARVVPEPGTSSCSQSFSGLLTRMNDPSSDSVTGM